MYIMHLQGWCMTCFTWQFLFYWRTQTSHPYSWVWEKRVMVICNARVHVVVMSCSFQKTSSRKQKYSINFACSCTHTSCFLQYSHSFTCYTFLSFLHKSFCDKSDRFLHFLLVSFHPWRRMTNCNFYFASFLRKPSQEPQHGVEVGARDYNTYFFLTTFLHNKTKLTFTFLFPP